MINLIYDSNTNMFHGKAEAPERSQVCSCIVHLGRQIKRSHVWISHSLYEPVCPNKWTNDCLA